MKQFLAVVLPLLCLTVYIWFMKQLCRIVISGPKGVCKIILWPSISHSDLLYSFLEATLWMILVFVTFFIGRKKFPSLVFWNRENFFFSKVSIVCTICFFLMSVFQYVLISVTQTTTDYVNRSIDLFFIFSISSISIAFINDEKHCFRAVGVFMGIIFVNLIILISR